MLNKVALRKAWSILQSCNAIDINNVISGKKTLVDLSEIEISHLVNLRPKLHVKGITYLLKNGKVEEMKKKVQEFESILVARKDKWKANGKLGNAEDNVEDVGDDDVEDP